MRETRAAAIASQSGSFESPPLQAASTTSTIATSAASALFQRVITCPETLSSLHSGLGLMSPRRVPACSH